MRQVGWVLGRPRAERFSDFLASQGIEAEIREEAGDHYAIWVFDEDQVAAADEHYRAFKAAPDAAAFNAPAKPRGARKSEEKRPKERGRYIDVRSEIFNRGAMSAMPVTVAMIAICVVLMFLANLPGVSGSLRVLYYSEYYGREFPEILSGQVWRLVTPIFLHGGIWHLLFNMLWIYQLGGAVEVNEGSRFLAVFTLVVAILINTAQYLISGPLFLGISGVVYALFGYIWMMSKYATSTRYFMARETVFIMIGWLVLCVLHIIPNVANTEHVGGLIVGAAWGLLRSKYLTQVIRRRRYKGKL